MGFKLGESKQRSTYPDMFSFNFSVGTVRKEELVAQYR